ncbi:MAG: DNA polymerase III subunit alpha, partial [Chlorobi bacterium]|nr:DNA polymerase III subunit alpha [Chlorobiota bacterium]
IDNPEDLDLHDQATYDLLSNGDTQAVFQFESQGMQEYLKQLKPQNLEELTAMNALYRPGPMGNIPEFIDRKHGRKPIEYLAPIMEKSLKNTYGIIVYQEQVMQLARDIGGFSLGGADILRRAMGKKKKKVMAAQKPKFLKGAAEHNIPEKIAIEIFELIEKFAEYGFNKSHSLAYSYLAYQTAWLKTHYPAEFLAANMTAEQNDQDKVVKLIEEAAKFDLEVVPPDVNKSFAGARAHGNKIFFGLAAIRNVGTGAVEGMIEVRKDKPFTSFFDFVSRADTKLINRRALEALICAGAFSTFDDNNRAAQFEAIDSALDYSKALHNSQNVDMDSLFGGAQEASLVEPTLSDIPDWTERERLTKEKEVLSFYISGNPMERFRPYIDSFGNLKLDDFGSKMLGNKAIICGMITALRTQFDSKGRKIAFATVEDFKGKAKCILWSKEYSNYGQALQEDSVVIVEGNTKLEGEEITIFADKVTQAEEYAREHVTGYSIRINLEEISLTKINDFNAVCNDASAVSKITFTLFDKSQRYMKRLFAKEVKIDRSPETIKKVIAIFGRDNVKLATFQ